MSTNRQLQYQSSLNGSSDKMQSVIPTNLASELFMSRKNQIPQVDLPSEFNPIVDVITGSQTSSAEKGTHLLTSPSNASPYQSVPANENLLSMSSLPRASNPIGNSLTSNLLLSPAGVSLSGVDALPISHSSMFVDVRAQPLNKRTMPMETSPKLDTPMPTSTRFHQFPSPLPLNKRPMPMVTSPKLQTAMLTGTGFHQLPNKKRVVQIDSQINAKIESFESVRSKLRESLAASLGVGSQQNSMPSIDENNTLIDNTKQEESGQGILSLMSSITTTGVWNSSEHMQSYKESHNLSNSRISSGNTGNQIEILKCRGGIEQSNSFAEHENLLDSTTMVKDELLQAHGLCWTSDCDMENVGMSASDLSRPERDVEDITAVIQPATVHQNPVRLVAEVNIEKPIAPYENLNRDTMETTLQTPGKLAVKIEGELFKLYGGVNKKYKEKARSLMFNLKDPNNPELRERVLTAEISPQRLCTMTAEELASKELSQWRLAKAEELAQMVVLPDSEVDIRRLVKKTHKGEVQVEVEQDDGVSVEVATGASVLSQVPSKAVDKREKVSPRPNDQHTSLQIENGASDSIYETAKNDLGKRIPPRNPALIEEKANLTQDPINAGLDNSELYATRPSVDDVLNDLHTVDPFRNLTVDTRVSQDTSGGKEDYHATDYFRSIQDRESNALVEVSISKPSESGGRQEQSHSNMKTDIIYKGTDMHPMDVTLKCDVLWEGVIQLNISSQATVYGFFKSGEKALTKEWPNVLDVKGRVRLDAFEKFLHELPLSRTRAVMIVQFCLQEGSDQERLNISETVDSYITDARVGFAEPVKDVEIYLCPPHAGTIELIESYLSKELKDSLLSAVNSIIGFVIWRKSHINVSPRKSSQHKHSGNKKKSSSSKQSSVDDYPKSLQSSPPCLETPRNPEPPLEETIDDYDDDDVPPGFGPANGNDEDDLPEFDFVHSAPTPSQLTGMSLLRHSHAPLGQVAQIRELIHKYGQGDASLIKSSLRTHNWNDDDDIPEWQPDQDNHPPLSIQPPQLPLPAAHPINLPLPLPQLNLPPPLPPPPPPSLSFEQFQQPFFMNQHLLQMQPPQHILPQTLQQGLHLAPSAPPMMMAPQAMPVHPHVGQMQQPLTHPQMRPMIQNLYPGWQATFLPPAGPPENVTFAMNNQYSGGIQPNGLFPGTPLPIAPEFQGGIIWPPDIPRPGGL